MLSSPAAAPCSAAAAPWILAATILGSSLAFIDGSVVNLALPAFQADLNATVIDAQWVVEAYALLLAALILVGGSLGDIYGRRRIYAAGVGPVLGGFLIEHGSWRWVFFINVPLAVIVLALTFWRVPESRNPHVPRSVDWVGAGLITAGLGGIVYALIESSKRSWNDGVV